MGMSPQDPLAQLNEKRDKAYAALEESIAIAMQEEALHNPDIQHALRTQGDFLRNHILNPLKECLLSLKSINDFDSLPEFVKKSITNLANHHSAAERQYGNVLAEYTNFDDIKYTYDSAKTILSSQDYVDDLFNTFERILRVDPNDLKDQHDIAKIAKVFVDLGYCYREFFPQDATAPKEHPLFKEKPELLAAMAKSAAYESIDNMLWPSPSEFSDRISYAQLGQEPYLQTKYVINKKPGDGLEPKKHQVGRITGGAFWAKVSTESSINHLITNYDKQSAELNMLNEKLENILSSSGDKNEITALNQAIKDKKITFDKLQEQMI